MTSELQTLIVELEQDRALGDPARVCERAAARDRLEAHLLDWHMGAGDERADSAGFYERAQAVDARLEAVDRELGRDIRREIRRGVRPERLLRWMSGPGSTGRPATPPTGEGYDHLDVLVSRVLRLEEPSVLAAEPTPEMVSYQPTPARHIFDLLSRTALSERDVLVDLGSGLGHVPLLASICTGARGVGIELEPAYVRSARRSAVSLHLHRVIFLKQDAREADFSNGTVFFLYTSFTGSILRAVLDRLRREATGREFCVGTLGPCTVTVAEEPWLQGVGPLQADRVAIFRPRERLP